MTKEGKAATDNGFTEDTLFDGELHCRQHRHGYRFSLDALLLAHFITPHADDRILDLGSGAGIVSLIIAYRWPQVRLVALELQERLAALIAGNIARNGYGDRISPVHGDLRQVGRYLEAGSFDWVVSNPPFRHPASGRQNVGQEQSLARHEITADLSAVVEAAAYALRTRGRAAFVYPARRGATLLATLRSFRLEPKRLQVVYSYPGSDGKLLLVEASKNSGEELTVMPPFHIYVAPGGDYSPEMSRLYAPGPGLPDNAPA